MGKLPSFQFYPGDWMSDVKLRRCSHAARGAWMDILCILHDSDEYGIVRWPLSELARTAGIPLKIINELVEKQVLRGGDSGISAPYIYVPRSGRKDGDPVTLIETTDKPIWYAGRLVKDAYRREHKGASSRFKPHPKGDTKPPENGAPSHRHGECKSDGSSSSSSSSISPNPLTPSVKGNESGRVLDQIRIPECLDSELGRKAIQDYAALQGSHGKFNLFSFQGVLEQLAYFSTAKAVGYLRAWHRRNRFEPRLSIDWEEYAPSADELGSVSAEKPKQQRVRLPRVQVSQ